MTSTLPIQYGNQVIERRKADSDKKSEVAQTVKRLENRATLSRSSFFSLPLSLPLYSSDFPLDCRAYEIKTITLQLAPLKIGQGHI